MNTLAKESVENSRASQLRLAFDSAFALPPSVASPPGEDLLTTERETQLERRSLFLTANIAMSRSKM